MIEIRKSADRGHAEHGWLDTYHTFSFADYHDRAFMGYSVLRVINEDVVAPGKGFGEHPHRDMEILTYVLSGALEHRDSMGSHGVIRNGDLQHMSAGTGVRHSEFNHSATEPVHLLQIWILPERAGLPPEYDDQSFPLEGRRNRLQLLAARGAPQGAMNINQDVKLFASILDGGKSVTCDMPRKGWLQVARGSVTVNGKVLQPGDGAAIADEKTLAIANAQQQEAEFLLFDLP